MIILTLSQSVNDAPKGSKIVENTKCKCETLKIIIITSFNKKTSLHTNKVFHLGVYLHEKCAITKNTLELKNVPVRCYLFK